MHVMNYFQSWKRNGMPNSCGYAEVGNNAKEWDFEKKKWVPCGSTLRFDENGVLNGLYKTDSGRISICDSEGNLERVVMLYEWDDEKWETQLSVTRMSLDRLGELKSADMEVVRASENFKYRTDFRSCIFFIMLNDTNSAHIVNWDARDGGKIAVIIPPRCMAVFTPVKGFWTCIN